VQLGLIASEKQAIDAALESLAAEDERVCPVADRYWNARGGSHTDGGAFVFTVREAGNGQFGNQGIGERGLGSRTGNGNGKELVVADKFGAPVTTPQDQVHNNPSTAKVFEADVRWLEAAPHVIRGTELDKGQLTDTPSWIVAGSEGIEAAWLHLSREVHAWDYGELTWFCQRMAAVAESGADAWSFAVRLLTRLRDRQFDPGGKRRASVVALVDRMLAQIFELVPPLGACSARQLWRVAWDDRTELRAPRDAEGTLVLDAAGFPPEGDDSAARLIVEAARLGWRRFIAYNWRGGRFCGCGLGPGSEGIRIDVYGSSGDYLGSGLQGAEVHVHGSAQDQVGQILKAGKLVIHGDVGQTFMYGAKGGEAYVLGNAAGRPLINAAGNPRVVINGTCLDYLAESFMAGDPLHGGGFVILNGVTFDAHGNILPQPTPYPGGNLFSLASGGALYVRDPHQMLSEDQLNGGRLVPMTEADWALIHPYLEENERLFGIRVEALLTVVGDLKQPEEVYRKVGAVRLAALK
jgi:glutamate synthase domain-containing protein 3